jgi:hypothetical protein
MNGLTDRELWVIVCSLEASKTNLYRLMREQPEDSAMYREEIDEIVALRNKLRNIKGA